MSRWIDRGKRALEIYRENNVSVYAGNATLFMVTAAAPFLMLIIAIVNLLPGYSPKDVTAVFFQLLPNLDSIRGLVESMVANLKSQSGGLLASVSALTTLWSASKGVSAIQKGLNQLNQVEETSKIRGLLKQLEFTLTLVVLFPALLVFEMLGDSIEGILFGALEKLDPKGLEAMEEGIRSFFHISALVVALLAFLVILQIYAKLPASQKSLKSQIPGALLTGVGWYAFTRLFAFFIPRFYHASSLYGSLASLFLVLLWLRFVIMILFAGEALNLAVEEDKANQ